MNKWYFSSFDDVYPILISAVVVYLAVVLYTRLAGKRSFSKMSSFDFAVTIAIGSVVASTILLKNVSILQGLVGLAALYLLQMLVAILRRYEWLRQSVDNEPLLLMDKDQVLEENLRKARVSMSDLKAKLREANVTHRNQILAVIFESTGDVSVLHSGSEADELDDWIMEGVKR